MFITYSPIDLIVSFIITWVIILIPPTIIRLLYKHHLSRQVSISLSAFFYVINLMIFIWLGSTNKSHAALLIGAYLSYRIFSYQSKSSEENASSQAPVIDLPSPNNDLQSDIMFRDDSKKWYLWLNNFKDLNYRKGLLRIWLVLVMIWVPFGLYQSWDSVDYTFKYLLKSDQLEKVALFQLNSEINYLTNAKDKINSQNILPSNFRQPWEDLSTGVVSEIDLQMSIISFTEEQSEMTSNRLEIYQQLLDENLQKQKKLLLEKVDARIAFLEKQVREFTLTKPDYRWIFFVIICPLLAIPAAYAFFWLIRGAIWVVYWIFEGFSPVKKKTK